MSQYQRSPTFGQVIDRLRETTKAQIRVALPCKVLLYDPVTQTVDVQPLIDDRIQQEDGTFTALPFPVLPHVPVAFPAGGGFRLTFPLQLGDTGQVLFNDLSIDTWQNQGGHAQAPDGRRHDISDAVFYPGLHADPQAWHGASVNAVTLGADTGPQIVVRANQLEFGGNDSTPPTDAIALASLVLSRLQAIVTAFNGHTHTDPQGGITGPPTPTMGAPASVGSTILKAE